MCRVCMRLRGADLAVLNRVDNIICSDVTMNDNQLSFSAGIVVPWLHEESPICSNV